MSCCGGVGPFRDAEEQGTRSQYQSLAGSTPARSVVIDGGLAASARLLFDGESDEHCGIAFSVAELDALGQIAICMAAEMERQGVEPR